MGGSGFGVDFGAVAAASRRRDEEELVVPPEECCSAVCFVGLVGESLFRGLWCCLPWRIRSRKFCKLEVMVVVEQAVENELLKASTTPVPDGIV